MLIIEVISVQAFKRYADSSPRQPPAVAMRHLDAETCTPGETKADPCSASSRSKQKPYPSLDIDV